MFMVVLATPWFLNHDKLLCVETYNDISRVPVANLYASTSLAHGTGPHL